MGRRRKRHWKTAGILTAIFALSAGSLWYFLRVRSNAIEMEDRGLQSDNANIITAAGVTENGIDAVTFAIDFLEDTRLCVEDVYISEGDMVAAGEAYIKFTDGSIQKARAELEKAVQDTELAYRSGVIASGEDKMQAKYTYDTAALEAEFAPQVYQDTLTQLEMQLFKAENDYQEAQEEYDAYYLAVANNTFYEDYQIEKLKKAYEDAYDLCTRRSEYWEVTEEELSMLNNSGQNAYAQQDDRQWIVRTVALLKEEALEAREEYEQARRDYQKEIEGAELKLQKLWNQLEMAQQNLTDAQLERQRGSVRAKTSYELAVARGQMAENEYHVRLMSLDDELERQKDARDAAVENKQIFEELVGDGYLYTERSGTIALMRAKEGQALTGGDVVLAYGDPEKIFVTVAVSGQDIERLSVGEKASVMIAGHGSFDGTVAMIQSASFDDIVSTRGTVMVALEGDVRALEPNLTAAVVFGESAQPDSDVNIVSAHEASVSDPGANAVGHKTVGTAPVLQMYNLDGYDSYIAAGAKDEDIKYLEVAEVYVETGQHIEAGDPVCRFTQESIGRVRKKFAYEQSEAQIALMRAQTDYHMGVLEAGLCHNEALVEASLAQTAYDNAIAGLNSSMVAKALEIEQLLADIYQLQLSLTDDGYVEQKTDITKAYDKAKKQMERVKESFVTSRVEAARIFQAAEDSYEDFFEQSEVSNQQIADKIEEVYAIQNEILQSRQLLEKELVSAEQKRTSSQIEGETANASYAASVKEYENAVNKAQADLDQAVQALDDLNRFVGDGTVYATGDGFVVKVGCRKGGLLFDAGNLLSYMADADMPDPIVVLQEEEGTQ